MNDDVSAIVKKGVRPIPVAIYTRVSTLHQVGGRFDSCASQEQLGREHIQKNTHKGYYLSSVFTDPAYSGDTMNRPGIKALMRHIEAGQAEVVLIFKFERVLRSTEDWTPFRAFLRKHKCRLESPIEDLADETPMQRFHNNMRANLAEYERNNTSEKVRIKMLEQAKRGLWNAGQIPYGYDYNRETQTLHPHPVEAAVVRRIFESAAQLVTMTDIANTLNDEGHRTKPRVFQRRDGTRETVGGNPFRSDHVQKIIRSPIYTGRVRLHGEEFAGKHEPIVSRELWERANAAVAKPVETPRRIELASDKHFHLLKGLVHCGCCGRMMIPDHGGKKNAQGLPYRYYTCGVHRRYSDRVTCAVRHVPAGLLESAVIRLMGSVGRREEIVQAVIQGVRTTAQTSRAEIRTRIETLDREVTQVSRRLANCIEAIAAGGAEAITDELRAKAAALKAEKDEFVIARERLRQELALHDLGAMDGKRIAEALTRFEELLPHLSPDEQKHLAALCVERVEVWAKPTPKVGADRELEIRLRLHAAQLVQGMEERVIVRVREARLAPITRRVMQLESRVRIAGSGRQAEILSPVREVLGKLTPSPAASKTPELRHPIHLALLWKKKLAANPALNHVALARTEQVSEATVSRTLKMLKLLPEIQEILLGLKTWADLRRYSGNRMVVLADLPPELQRERFARLAP